MAVSQRPPILFLPPHVSCVYTPANAVSQCFLSQSGYFPSWSVRTYHVSDGFMHTVLSDGFMWIFPEGI